MTDSLFRDADDFPHQDHQREKDLCNQASQLLRQEDIPPPHDGENKQEAAGDHQKDEKGQDEAENQGEGGVNISQPHHGNIPKKKDEDEKNDAGKGQQTDENSLLRLILQQGPLVHSNIDMECPKF